MTQDILYYPSIEFQSEEWVKNALLYWDRIRRIVPENYNPQDSDFIRELQEAGLIKNITPTQRSAEDASAKFRKLADKVGLLRNIQLAQGDPHLLHTTKIQSLLAVFFQAIGIAEKIDDEWLRMNRCLAGYYMIFLADCIAKSRNLVTGTDNEECWAINPYFLEQGNFPTEETDINGDGVYAQLVINDILPANVQNLSAKDIIDLSTQRKDVKAQLRSKISEFVSLIPKITCIDELQDQYGQFLNEIKEAKEEYKKSTRFLNSDLAYKTIMVGVPAMAKFYLHVNPIIIALDIAMNAFGTIRDYKKLKKNRSKSYQSYLVGLDKACARQSAIAATSHLREFL